jgi:hypothetical protein
MDAFQRAILHAVLVLFVVIVVPFASLVALVALAREYMADHQAAARPARVIQPSPARNRAHSDVAGLSGETVTES